MLQIRRILYPTDFSATARQVFDHALFFAEHHGAELHMLHAVVLHDHDPADPERRFPDSAEILEHLFSVAESEMARLAGDHASSGFSLIQERRRGFSVPEVILEYAQEIDADLIVLGTHGRRAARRFILGSAADRVVREAACPVLTLRRSDEPPAMEAFERLLVPIDFSDSSAAALSAARELAAAYSGSLDLLHVFEQPPYPYFYTLETVKRRAELQAELEKRSREELAKLMAEAEGPEVEFRLHVEMGRPAERIVGFAAEHGADMIVLSTHGLSGIERMLIGSTAEEVVRTAECPVFVVKSFGKRLA